jgi:hypothetical protein
MKESLPVPLIERHGLQDRVAIFRDRDLAGTTLHKMPAAHYGDEWASSFAASAGGTCLRTRL